MLKIFHLVLAIFIAITVFPSTEPELGADDSLSATNLLAVAKSYYDKQPDRSVAIIEEALQIAVDINSVELQVRAKRSMGYCYTIMGNYDLAAQSYFRVLELVGVGSSMSAEIYNRLGEIMRQNGSFNDAYKYHFKSLRMLLSTNDSLGLASTFNSLALVHEMKEYFDSALYYHGKSLKIMELLHSITGMATSYSNLGTIYRKTGDLDKALEMQLRTLSIDLDQGDKINIAITHNNLGVIYMDQGRFGEAANHLEIALVLSVNNKALDISKYANQQLAILQGKLHNYDRAYDYFKTYLSLKDSLFNEDKSKEIGKLEAKYEFEKELEEGKRIEIELQKIKNEKINRRNTLQYSIIVIVMVMFFASILALTRSNIPVRLMEGLIFFSFLLFFEFTLVMLDPYIEQYSSGAPAIKLAFNAALAGLIFPLHSYFEMKLKARIK
ncbi:MAG: hypothetical protein COB85_05325 [Bacteroidetes bacterium]|nr:MAG: hypothetical protein COB85_05325 [Bacteroidota bacterium]